MVNTAFKPYGDILTPTPKFVPWPPSLQNFSDAVHKPLFGTYLRNSLLVTLGVVVISIVVAFSAAAALTRFRFPGRRTFLILVLAVQMIPQPALLIPVFLSLKSLHMLNSLVGLTLTYVAIVLPFTIWTLRGFLHGVPVELEEAAMVAGSTLFAVPVVVFFMLIQRRLVAGMTAGAVKE